MRGYAITLTGGGRVEVDSYEFSPDEDLLIWRDPDAPWPFIFTRSEWVCVSSASNVINAAASGGTRRMKRNRKESELAKYLADRQSTAGPLFGAALLQKARYAAGKDDTLHVYEGGVYVPGWARVKHEIQKLAGSKWTRTMQNETMEWLLGNAPELDDYLDPNVINVLNGLLRWNGKRWRLTGHDPDLLTTVQLPVTYDPKAKCPVYDAFLESSQPVKAVRDFLDEWVGYSLTSDCTQEAALLNLGKGGDGKSVFLFVKEALLGGDNVAAKTLQSVATEDNRFAAADLYGKLANIYPDLSASELRETGRFKALTSGDLISAEKKSKHPFQFHSVAKMTFSANQVPASRDGSRGYYDRWKVTDWPNRFRGTKAEDKHLKGKIVGSEAEMSGLLNRALTGLTRLRRTGKFTDCSDLQIARAKFRVKSDNVAAYLRDVQGKKVRRKQTDWYTDYQAWCAESRHEALSRNNFYDRMRSWDSAHGMTVVGTRVHNVPFFTVSKVKPIGKGRHRG